MIKSYRLVVLIALLTLSACASAFAVTFPTVEYVGFDLATYTYTYKVTQPNVADCIYAIDNFEVDTYLPVGTAYTASGPFLDTPNGTDWDWNVTDGYVTLSGFMGVDWSAPDTDYVVWPGEYLDAPWVMYFKLQVPNSAPVTGPLGDAVTRQLGTIESEHSNPGITVPGPVPEPSSLLALGGLCAGFLPALLRRRAR